GTAPGDADTRAAGTAAHDGLPPRTPMASLQALLAKYTLGPTDLVAIDTGTYNSGGPAVIDRGHAGAAYFGAPGGSTFTYGGNASELSGASNTLLYGLAFAGNNLGIYAHPDAP